jgi:hypothetical protein
MTERRVPDFVASISDYAQQREVVDLNTGRTVLWDTAKAARDCRTIKITRALRDQYSKASDGVRYS